MFEVQMMNNKSVYFNQYGEIVGKGYDGKNEFEKVLLNRQQIAAIELVIQKYNGRDHCQN